MEGYLRVCGFQRKFIHSEGFLNKTALGCDKRFEIFQTAVGEQALRHGNADAARLIRISLCFLSVTLVDIKAFIIDMFQQPLDDLTVGAVVKGQAAVPVDGEIIYLVVKGRGAAVLCGNIEPFGNGFHQPFAFRTMRMDRDRHCSDLLDVW